MNDINQLIQGYSDLLRNPKGTTLQKEDYARQFSLKPISGKVRVGDVMENGRLVLLVASHHVPAEIASGIPPEGRRNLIQQMRTWSKGQWVTVQGVLRWQKFADPILVQMQGAESETPASTVSP